MYCQLKQHYLISNNKLGLYVHIVINILLYMYKFDLPRREPQFSNKFGSYSSQNSRVSYSLNHRPVVSSPKANQFKDKRFGIKPSENKMRLYKSRVQNFSMSRQGFNQKDLFPEELLFLLGNEEGNVEFLRKKIEDEKSRIHKEFEHFLIQMNHIFEDLKVSIDAQLDQIYRDFINMYKQLKTHIAELREMRRNIIQNFQENQTPRPLSQYNAPNNQTSKSIPANHELLQEISRDAQYFRNHRLYEEITNAHIQAMGTITTITNDIITIGGHQQTFYSEERLKEILQKLKSKIQKNVKGVFDEDLQSTVKKVSDMIEDNNMLLKGLNIDEQRLNDEKIMDFNPDKNNLYSPRNQNSNKVSYNSHSNKNIGDKQAIHPYGLSLPFKNNNVPERQTALNMRPTSRSQYQQNLNSRRHSTNWQTSSKPQYESEKGRYQGGVNGNTKITDFNISPCQQTIIIPHAENIKTKLFAKNPKIFVNEAESSLLCAVFLNSGKHIAFGSRDFKIYVFDVSTGRLVTKLVGHDASVCSIANLGSFFVSGGDNGCNSIIIWDSNSWKIKRKIISVHKAAVSCILDFGDGNNFATGGYDKLINIFNYQKGDSAFSLNSNRSAICVLSWNSHNKKMISAGLDQTLTIWTAFFLNGIVSDLSLERIITSVGLVCSMQSLSLAYDCFVIGNKQGKIKILNINTGECVKTFTVGTGSVVELAIIERQNKAGSPLIISYSHRSQDLTITKSEIGMNGILETEHKINIEFGCGIGPKIIFSPRGVVAILSHSPLQKSASLYEIYDS